MNGIKEQLFKMDPTGDMHYCDRYFMELIQSTYKGIYYFSKQERKKKVLWVADIVSNVVCQFKKSADNGNDGEDKILCKAAAKVALSDIALAKTDPLKYQSMMQISDIAYQLQLIPASLKEIMYPLLKTDERVAEWGLNMMKIARPRSGVQPHGLGVALQLDQRMGSKWSIEKMHILGYCESYAEVTNYKYCILRDKFKTQMQEQSS